MFSYFTLLFLVVVLQLNTSKPDGMIAPLSHDHYEANGVMQRYKQSVVRMLTLCFHLNGTCTVYSNSRGFEYLSPYSYTVPLQLHCAPLNVAILPLFIYCNLESFFESILIL